MSINKPLRVRLRPTWVISIVLVILLLCVSAYMVHESQVRQRAHVERELQVINQLQRQSVQAWYDQRLTDAAALMDDATLGAAALAFLRLDDASNQAELGLQRRLQGMLERHDYTGVWLLDTQGQIRMSPAGHALSELPDVEQARLAQTFTRAEAAIVPPRHDPAFEYPFLSLLVPLFHEGESVAAIWLVMDVRLSLYPILERWPVRSTTAGSTLVMREDDEAVFLSPVNDHGSDPSLSRTPISQVDSPAVKAVKGMRGLYTGRHEAGMPMIAVASSLRGVSWVLLSTVQLDEAMHGEWQDLLRLIAPIVLTLVTAGLVLMYAQHLAWRRERALKQALQAQVRIDDLTAIANRLALNERLTYEWQRAARQQTSLALLMIDIDYFKQYNDYYGHLRGDEALKQVASLITSVVTRSVDMVARYGGEEFVVIMPDTSGSQAMQVAETICQRVRQAAIAHEHSQVRGVITVSIGVAADVPSKQLVSTGPDNGAITLLRQADMALYRAKEKDRDQVALYHAALDGT